MASRREAIVLRDPKRGQRFMFPVNPPEISISDGRSFNEIPIVGLGVALLAGPVSPQEISFESFFPRQYDASFCNYTQLETPEDSIERILFWMGRSRTNRQITATPLRVTVTGTQFSQLMVITDFQQTFRGGEPDAVYFSIQLRQWRRQRVRVEEDTAAATGVTTSSSTPDERDEPPTADRTYTVVRGDSLWKIAKRFYGSGSKWRTIFNANRSIIGANANLIYPGQVFVIP